MPSIYLVRHAIAAERGDDWPDDTKRPLTPRGIARMREVVRGLAALDPGIAVVLTSPLVRARQTADLLKDGLRPSPRLDVLPILAPGGAPAAVAEATGEHAKADAIALVGHEPDLGELAAWLTGARAPFAFKKGGICRIDVPSLPPSRHGQLQWLATPRMLRSIR